MLCEGIQPCKGNLLMLNQSKTCLFSCASPVPKWYCTAGACNRLGRQDGQFILHKSSLDFIMDRDWRSFSSSPFPTACDPIEPFVLISLGCRSAQWWQALFWDNRVFQGVSLAYFNQIIKDNYHGTLRLPFSSLLRCWVYLMRWNLQDLEDDCSYYKGKSSMPA